MKKKILFSIVSLFVVFLFAVRVDAAIAKLNIGNDTKAKIPETVPSTSDDLYGTVTEAFDFSKLQFSSASGTTNIEGMGDLKKIILGKKKADLSGVSEFTLNTTFEKWFTAYCLDNQKKYPIYGLLTSKKYNDATDNAIKLDEAVLAAIANDAKVEAAVKAKSGLDGNITSIQVVSLDNTGAVSERYYTLNEGDTAEGLVANIESLNVKVSVKLEKIVFWKGSQQIELLAKEITGNDTDTSYTLEFYGSDILLEKYDVTDVKDRTKLSGYDHALWIIEHSYPTLALKTSVEAAGGNFEALRKEICEIEGHTYDDANNACTGFNKLDDYVENYVYGTIQYAIWKSTGHTIYGETLGDSVVNSVELNKLFKYLIKNRSEYNGYSTKTFTNKITIDGPKEGTKPKEKNKALIYGPYDVYYDALAGGDMTLSVTNTDKKGIKLVDEDGDEITTIENGDSFYISCDKAANISNVTVSVKLEDASVFDPLTNRGRIYYPRYSIEQNVMSGGKIINKDLEATVDLVANPNTGVENVALLLMVTLIAFSLAYLLLSYKQKPVQLN